MTNAAVLDRTRNNYRGVSKPGKQPRKQKRLLNPSEMTHTGTIKWYADGERPFGFIIPDGGGKDVFLHRSVVRQYGILERDLIKGTPVRFVATDGKPGLRPEADAIALG